MTPSGAPCRAIRRVKAEERPGRHPFPGASKHSPFENLIGKEFGVPITIAHRAYSVGTPAKTFMRRGKGYGLDAEPASADRLPRCSRLARMPGKRAPLRIRALRWTRIAIYASAAHVRRDAAGFWPILRAGFPGRRARFRSTTHRYQGHGEASARQVVSSTYERGSET